MALAFLGKNAMPVLKERYEVTTCGITKNDMIKANFVTDVPELPEKYDIVLHACGKAHVVPKTEAEKKAFFDVNYTGTKHLCEALEKVGVPKAIVFISTVAVYGCEYGDLITEEHPLEGKTPYAKSKIMAEEYQIDNDEKAIRNVINTYKIEKLDNRKMELLEKEQQPNLSKEDKEKIIEEINKIIIEKKMIK